MEIEDRELKCDVRPPAVIEGRVYRRCDFGSSDIGPSSEDDGTVRPVVRDVRLERCRSDSLSAYCAVLDDVVIADHEGEVWMKWCALRHVELVGRFANLQIAAPRRVPGWISEEGLAVIVAENAAIGEAADWVLDVREATFRNCMIRDVPPDKIRIDPDRQAVITVESMRDGAARLADVKLAGVGIVGMKVGAAINGKLTDPVVVVEAGSRQPDEQLAIIRALHERGLALPVI